MFSTIEIPPPTIVLPDSDRGMLAKCPSYTKVISPNRLLERLANTPKVAIDTETTGLRRPVDRPVCWSMSDGEERWFLRHQDLQIFKRFLEDPSHIQTYANANFDAWMLLNGGVDVMASGRKNHRRLDIIVMHALLYDNQDHDLKFIGETQVGVRMLSFKQVFGKPDAETGVTILRVLDEDPYKCIDYASLDAWVTYKAEEILWSELEQTEATDNVSLLEYYLGLEMPLHDVLWQMERKGIVLDIQKACDLRNRLDDIRKDRFADFTRVLGRVINPNSSDQLRDVFFRRQQNGEWVDLDGNPPGKLTKGGKSGNKKPSTDKEFLTYREARKCPLATELSKYRKADTAAKYIDGYLEVLTPEGRIHTSFNQAVAATGRLCVAGSTELVTSLGTFRIDELDLRSKHQNVTIQTHAGRQRKILNLFYKGKEEMFRVTASDGSSITCTAGHGLLAAGGWTKVGKLRRGSLVWSTRSLLHGGEDSRRERRRLPNHTERGGVRLSVPDARVHGSRSAEAVPSCEQNHSRAGQEAVPGKVRGGAQKTSEQASRHRSHGKSTRGVESHQSLAGRGSTSGIPGKGDSCASHRTQFRGYQKRSASEHEALRTQPNAHHSTEATSRRCGLHAATGGLFARYRREGQELLSGPSRVLHRPIRCALRNTEARVVRESARALAWQLQGAELHTEKPHLVEYQQVRVETLHGTHEARHRARQGGGARWEDEGRLRVSGYGSVSGGRRRIPHAQRRDESAGREERGGSASRWSGNSPSLDQGRGQQPELCGVGNRRLRAVVSIESVGVQDVWDIEVEEDHSYIAQGLIHHNSSSDPNLQNVSKDNDDFAIRSLFIAPDGFLLGDSDQEQLEMRIAASLSQDRLLIEAITSGRDLHTWTAHKMFGLNYEDIMVAKDVEKALRSVYQRQILEQRDKSKTLNFGVMYGETAYLLAKQMGVDVPEAEQILETYWAVYSGLKQLFADIHVSASENFYIQTPLGRRRWIHQARVVGLSRRDYARGMRQAGNMPVQGYGAEILKASQLRIYNDDDMWNADFRMVLQVHDELVCEGPEWLSKDQDFINRFERYMCYPFGDDREPLVGVKLAAKLGWGHSWSEAK